MELIPSQGTIKHFLWGSLILLGTVYFVSRAFPGVWADLARPRGSWIPNFGGWLVPPSGVGMSAPAMSGASSRGSDPDAQYT